MNKYLYIMAASATAAAATLLLGAEPALPPRFKFDPASKGLAMGEGDRWTVLRREFATIRVETLARAIDNQAATCWLRS